MLDITHHGTIERKSSDDSSVVVVSTSETNYSPAGAASVAVMLKKIGGLSVSVLGALGYDENGRKLLGLMSGIDTHSISIVRGFTTTTKVKTVVGEKLVSRHDHEEKFTLDLDSQIILDKDTIVVVSDYDKGVVEQAQSFLKQAHESGCKIVADPKHNVELYYYANILKPNGQNLLRLGGVQKIFDRLPFLEQLVITSNGDGVSLYNRDSKQVDYFKHELDQINKKNVRSTAEADNMVLVMMVWLIRRSSEIKNARVLARTASVAVSMPKYFELDMYTLLMLDSVMEPVNKFLLCDTELVVRNVQLPRLRRVFSQVVLVEVLSCQPYKLQRLWEIECKEGTGCVFVVTINAEEKDWKEILVSCAKLPFVDYVFGYVDNSFKHLLDPYVHRFGSAML